MTRDKALLSTLSLASSIVFLAAPAQAQHAAPQLQANPEPNRQDQVEGLEVDAAPSGFLSGSTLRVKPRTYYLGRDRETKPDSVGWAAGGAVEFKSGWLADRLQLAASLYTSQILYGPEEKDGTALFKPGPEPFTVLGEANVTLRLAQDNVFRVGRQSFDLPWLARHDIRMAPNTFEAVAVGRPASNPFGYVVGYVDAIKRKNDDRFIPMSEAAGAAGSDRGLGVVGAQYTFKDTSLIAATNQTSFDVMNTLFVKAERSFPIAPDRAIRLYAQYTDQRSVGDELIGAFETHLVAAKAELTWNHASFRIAASSTGDERGMQSPFGGSSNYLSIIVENFDRAGERAVMVGASYDFAGVGIEGLSAFANVSTGRTPDVGPQASPDQTEYNLTFDYRFADAGWAEGLAVRLRGAWIDQDDSEIGADDFLDVRVIVNYAIDVF